MQLGTSQIDITPKPGVELSGFAARTQPSTGVLDPLFAKALFLAQENEKLLWIHCDLVGFDRAIVLDFRRWGRKNLGLRDDQIMLSATHTHSGPPTIRLQEAGEYDPHYIAFLHTRLHEVAQMAVGRTESVQSVFVEGHLGLAIDRRKTASAHTDPRIAALGFCRPDKSFAAVVVNYAMHPVALGSSNRRISADIPGQAAAALAQRLAGDPLILVTNGACANLNPPAEGVPFDQIQVWGRQMADAVAPLLAGAKPRAVSRLRVASLTLPLPTDQLDAEGIHEFAQKALRDEKSLLLWGDKYRRVVEHWKATLLAGAKAGANGGSRDAELFAVCLDDVLLLGANAEVFSEFTDSLRNGSRKKVYLIGYANGDLGYLPTRAAYAEGGYEVDVAHMFYGGFRPKPGGLELLAHQARGLLRSVSNQE